MTFMNDLRYAFRGWRRSPAVAGAAVLSLGLGIGASLSIFSVTNAVLLRPLPVAKPSELVVLRYVSQKGNVFDSFGYEEYTALREVPGALQDLAALSSAQMNLSSEEATERVDGQLITGNFFRVLGIQPRIGRLIQADDERAGAGQPVCVISAGLWQRRFGSSPNIVGRQLRINGRVYSVVGVTPDGFDGIEQGTETQLYVPVTMATEFLSLPADTTVQPPYRKWQDWMRTIGRLAPGVARARAEAALDARFDQLPIAHRTTSFEMASRHAAPGPRARLLADDGRSGFDDLRVGYRRPLLILLFLVVLLLAIACANVANLLLARAAGRTREIAIRISLGGGSWLLLRQLLAESVLLAAGGAAAGGVLALWMSDFLLQIANSGNGPRLDARPDWMVFAFLVGVTFLTALLFGVSPAISTARTHIALSLKNQSGGAGRRRGVGSLLVVAQVALSVTLLGGAGLLMRSLRNIESIATGFQAQNVLLASISPGANRYSTEQSRAKFLELMDRAETIPGVKTATASLMSPLSGNLWAYSVQVPGYPSKPTPMVYFNAIGPGYFAALGSQLADGREFTRADRAGAPSVAVVSERMAKKFWPGRQAVGQHFQLGRNQSVEVVGVVRDSIYRQLRETPPEVVYMPLLQGEYRSATLELRVAGDHAHVFNDLRSAARQIDRDLPLYDLKTMEAQIAGTLSPERMLAVVSTVFGALALLLAVVGLYGVLAYAVTLRTREIGIRMALGAAQRQVVSAVLRDAFLMVGAGLVLGVPLSMLASKWIATFLYGLKAGDPTTYAGVVLVLCAAAAGAAIVPSRRASRVDPMIVLRWE